MTKFDTSGVAPTLFQCPTGGQLYYMRGTWILAATRQGLSYMVRAAAPEQAITRMCDKVLRTHTRSAHVPHVAGRSHLCRCTDASANNPCRCHS